MLLISALPLPQTLRLTEAAVLPFIHPSVHPCIRPVHGCVHPSCKTIEGVLRSLVGSAASVFASGDFCGWVCCLWVLGELCNLSHSPLISSSFGGRGRIPTRTEVGCGLVEGSGGRGRVPRHAPIIWEPGLTFEFQGQEVLSTGGWKLVAPFGGGARLQRGWAACLANAPGQRWSWNSGQWGASSAS